MTFYHSGQLGDIIYSLPVVKFMGGGDFITGIDYSLYAALAPLLIYQDYVFSVKHISETSLPRNYVNLDVFRLKADYNKTHLCDQHLNALQLKFNWRNSAWITAPAVHIEKKYAVINRTKRYQDRFYNWKKEIQWLKERTEEIFFVGTCEEWESFPVLLTHKKCENLLQIASLIQSAKYFSGNQSVCLAITQALNRSYRMEQSPYHRDCNTKRGNETILNSGSRRVHWFTDNLKRFFQQP